MKFANNFRYPYDAPSEYLERMCRDQAINLLDIMLSHIEKDKWYAIRLSDGGTEQREPFAITQTMEIEIEDVTEKHLVHVSTEKIHLTPSVDKSFFEKLKNCIRYMKDKTGGMMMEEGEVK